MELAPTDGLTAKSMSVNGKMVSKMVRESMFQLTEVVEEDFGKQARGNNGFLK